MDTVTTRPRDRQFRPLPVPDVEVRGLFGERQDAICASTAATLLDRCVEARMLEAIDPSRPSPGIVIPIGGYDSFRHGHPNHVNPEEAVQVFEDVRGRLLVPMHWGTFAMNREPFREPPDRLLREARQRGVEDRVAVLSPGQTIPW